MLIIALQHIAAHPGYSWVCCKCFRNWETEETACLCGAIASIDGASVQPGGHQPWYAHAVETFKRGRWTAPVVGNEVTDIDNPRWSSDYFDFMRETVLIGNAEEQLSCLAWLTRTGVEVNFFFYALARLGGYTDAQALSMSYQPEVIARYAGVAICDTLVDTRAWTSNGDPWAGFGRGGTHGLHAALMGAGQPTSIQRYVAGTPLYLCPSAAPLPAAFFWDPNRWCNSPVEQSRYAAFDDFRMAMMRGLPTEAAYGLLRDGEEYSYLQSVANMHSRRAVWRTLVGGIPILEKEPSSSFRPLQKAAGLASELRRLFAAYISSRRPNLAFTDLIGIYISQDWRMAAYSVIRQAHELAADDYTHIKPWRDAVEAHLGLGRLPPGNGTTTGLWTAPVVIDQSPDVAYEVDVHNLFPGGEGWLSCLAHGNLVNVGDSGPTEGTGPMACGCNVGYGDHKISADVRILTRGANWTAMY